MLKKLNRIKVLSIGTVLIGSLLLGIFIFSNTSAQAVNSGQSKQTDNNVIKVNQNGETYGSMANAKSVEEEPDLISARGVDGTMGYIKKTDLNKGVPRTLEEAAEYMKNLKNLEQYPYMLLMGKQLLENIKLAPHKLIKNDPQGLIIRWKRWGEVLYCVHIRTTISCPPVLPSSNSGNGVGLVGFCCIRYIQNDSFSGIVTKDTG